MCLPFAYLSRWCVYLSRWGRPRRRCGRSRCSSGAARERAARGPDRCSTSSSSARQFDTVSTWPTSDLARGTRRQATRLTVAGPGRTRFAQARSPPSNKPRHLTGARFVRYVRKPHRIGWVICVHGGGGSSARVLDPRDLRDRPPPASSSCEMNLYAKYTRTTDVAPMATANHPGMNR